MCINVWFLNIFISVLNMIITPDGQFVKQQKIDQNQNAFKFDWVPPNVHKDLASEYMQMLPSDKLPISGSEGALYRRQQLEKQVPLHDFNANVCHDLTVEEADAMSSYLQNLKDNAVGQGLVKKLSDNTNPLPLFKNMNIVPKPFKKMYNQPIEDEEFPPPPPELLYPPNTDLKTPSTFIGSKNFSKGNQAEINILDNANNNPAVFDEKVISQWPTSSISRSETLPQPQTNVSLNIQNDNYKPMFDNKNIEEPLHQHWEEGQNADIYVLPDGEDLFCKQCNGNVLLGQVAVMAERTGKEVLWHPSCFVCTTCEVIYFTTIFKIYFRYLYYINFFSRNYWLTLYTFFTMEMSTVVDIMQKF